MAGKVVPYDKAELRFLNRIVKKQLAGAQLSKELDKFVKKFPHRTKLAAHNKYFDCRDIAAGKPTRNEKYESKLKGQGKTTGWGGTRVKGVSKVQKKKTEARHPVKKGHLAVSHNEIRFAYKGIRIEDGEVVITF